MAERVTYYAIVRDRSGTDGATGLLRRRFTPEGRVDESLRRDSSWQASSALFEWEMGDVSGRELAQTTEADAGRLAAALGERWAGLD